VKATTKKCFNRRRWNVAASPGLWDISVGINSDLAAAGVLDAAASVAFASPSAPASGQFAARQVKPPEIVAHF
jgi:hypothetical protein